MIHRRGVLPILVLVAIIIVGAVVQIVRGPGTATSVGSSGAGAHAMPAPTGADRPVLRSLAAVQRAYDAGDVKRLCRPAALVDPAVIRAQNVRGPGCESELESLMGNRPSLRVKVRGLAVGRELAEAVVATTAGDIRVDFVRRRGRWLLSFSDGQDPLPALAGTF